MTWEFDNRSANVAGISLTVLRVGLGTWAIGGSMWSGTDEEESVQTIRTAGERGVNLIYPSGARGGPLR